MRLEIVFASATLVAPLVAPIGAQSPLFEHHGDASDVVAGFCVAAVEDVDGDGRPDVGVGLPHGDQLGPTGVGRARVYSGATGAVLHEWTGDAAGDFFAFALDGAGDVNADGFADVVVGAWSSRYVRVFSGLDGTELYQFDGGDEQEAYGWSVAGAGDVNDDGHADVIVGAFHDSTVEHKTGSATVYSGADGSVLHQFVGAELEHMGYAVDGAGDVDGDGHADLIVGSVLTDDNGDGFVEVYSGATGGVLYTVVGDGDEDDFFGLYSRAAGDVNGDGVPDLMVGAIGDDTVAQDAGEVRVYLGPDGAHHVSIGGEAAAEQLGYGLGAIGDVDGDGRDDLALGAWAASANGALSGVVRVYSGTDGAKLYEVPGPAAGAALGRSVDGLGDVNGDGAPDFVAGAPGADEAFANAGLALVSSSTPLTLVGLPHEVSVAAGGAQELVLDAGASHGGELAWLVGSASGTTPGLPLAPGVTLPLVVDGYLLLTLGSPNTPPLTGSLANLDGAGQGLASFALPARGRSRPGRHRAPPRVRHGGRG